MFYIQNRQERLYLMEYGPDHPFHSLQYTWTNDYAKRKRYATEAEAVNDMHRFRVEAVSVVRPETAFTKGG